jgi:predicted dehydrogenase
VANGELVRLGVVGCGLISQLIHLPALNSLTDRFRVVAVADPSERARTAAVGGADTYASHEDMLERAALDAVLVASPNGTHARVTLDALAAGLHVLVEKPLCITAADAGRIVERANGRVVQVGYMKRFDPAYEALVPPAGPLLVTTATVDPGIGDTYRPAGATDVVPAEAETREQVAAALGDDDPRHVRPFSDAFLGALVHDVNLVLGLLDEPVGVTDAAAASDGSLAYGAFALQGGGRWTAAWMLIAGAEAFREELRLYGADGVRTLTFAAPYDRPGSDSYTRQLAHFHDCITDGIPCRTPAAQGARDVALLTELYRAAIA